MLIRLILGIVLICIGVVIYHIKVKDRPDV
jgi:hypothetical protein